MKHWFTHQVKIQELDLPLEAIGEKVKLLDSHLAFLTFVLRAEDAVQIADVGYF